ncbi:MAG: HAD hydrolase-like protein, partial [Candidatus Margulisbacteria bacterium]|nr:HAD hydrolase-like protein [Candidatus Margulisiibacteriota bacterium]
DVNYNALSKKGYTNLVFDVDNTLVERINPLPDIAIKDLLLDLKKKGFKIVLVSNNSNSKRLIAIADYLQTEIVMLSFKPLPFVYRKLQKDFGFLPRNTVFFGDQLFTDILGAKLHGYYTVYIYPIGVEVNWVRKNYINLEKVLIRRMLRQN